MKLRNIISAVAVASALLMTSCNDFLDTLPTESYGDDVVWASQSNVEAFVTSNYGNAFQWYADQAADWDHSFSNNMINVRNTCPGEARGMITNDSNYGLNGRFGAIRNCNIIIERVAESTVLDDSYKVRYTAEAKFMRAMLYYDLARKFGRFMWVDKVLTPNDNLEVPLTKSISESYALVLKDIRDAVTGLPASAAAGRPTRNAALALLSEACLTAAAYTNNDSSLYVSSGVDLYQEAINAVDAIEGKSLTSNFENMFNQNGAYDQTEIILARYWSKDTAQWSGTGLIQLMPNVLNSSLATARCLDFFNVPDIFEGWLEYSPSQNLVDDFLVVDQSTGKAVRWYESSQFVNNTRPIAASAIAKYDSEAETPQNIAYYNADEMNDTYFKGYEVTTDANISELMYANRDARFDATIIHDGSTWYNEDITTCFKGNMSRWSSSTGVVGNNHVPISNYVLRKYVYTDASPRPFYNVYTDYHKIVFRYGRALLNKAEAQLRKNDISGAVATLNETRTKHGQLPASTASTLAEAWADYKIERRVELVWESDWYFSLLRWGKYGGEANDGKAADGVIDELTEPAMFVEIGRDRKVAYVAPVAVNNNMQRVFNAPRAYLLPIPRGVIQANPAISDSDQNPGWE